MSSLSYQVVIIIHTIPIYKSGVKNSVKNYRSMSLQLIISRIPEEIIHKHLLSHLQEYNLLTERQFGFYQNRLLRMSFSQPFWTGTMTSKLAEVWWLLCLIWKLLIKFSTDSFSNNLRIKPFMVGFCLGFVPTLQIDTNILWSMVLPLNLFLFFLGFPGVLSFGSTPFLNLHQPPFSYSFLLW